MTQHSGSEGGGGRRGRFIGAVALLVVAAGAASALVRAGRGEAPIVAPPAQNTAAPGVAPPQAGAPARYPVLIHKPDGPPRLVTDELDTLGRPVTIACSTCHTIREPDAMNRAADALDEFHQGLTYAHGDLTCLSCHNRNDYDALRLADGSPLPFTEVMTLCAQCHGPQARDYAAGAHGGMTGYWDLTRGPRERNNCIHCHDPHGPAYPTMMPTFKPKDRFLTPKNSQGGDGHE